MTARAGFHPRFPARGLSLLLLASLAASACAKPIPSQTPAQKSLLVALRKSRFETLKQKCAENDALSCGLFGNRTVGEESPITDKVAREALERSCAAGSAFGCLQLGTYLEGTGSPGDGQRGQSLRQKACAQGIDLCREKMSPRERQEAHLAHLRTLCAEGKAAACLQHGFYLVTWRYDGQRSEEGDFATSRTAFNRACVLGMAPGCMYQAYLEENGLGGPANPARGRALYEDACKLGDRIGCAVLHDRGGSRGSGTAAEAP